MVPSISVLSSPVAVLSHKNSIYLTRVGKLRHRLKICFGVLLSGAFPATVSVQVPEDGSRFSWGWEPTNPLVLLFLAVPGTSVTSLIQVQ